MLLAAQGLQNKEIAEQLGVGRVQVSRWRERNYTTHKHPVVQQWLAKHPRFNMHFTPTLASWLEYG